MSLDDVGMQYSLAVMFHSFPVVWRENTEVKLGTLTLHTPLGHEVEWDSPAEVRGRRKMKHITITTTSQCR